ncbi:MAG: DUF2779 domain-containing protein [Erysipelotrichaceae bacterium]|nr:DUF2779 domain-containing protein [Erysipelotrichaceae bacterium]
MYRFSMQDTSNNDFFPYFNFAVSPKDSIKNKFRIEEAYYGSPNETNEQTFEALKKYNWLFDARMVYRELRIRVPLMFYEDGHCVLYFIYYQIAPTSDETRTIKLTKDVIERNGLVVDEIFLIHLNGDYVRGETLDDDALWIVTDSFYNVKSNPTKPIKDYVETARIDVDTILDEIENTDFDNLKTDYSSKCSGRNKCQYFARCFPDEAEYEDNSVLTLVSSAKKHKLFESGIRYLRQLEGKDIEGNRVQYSQIMADKNGGLFIDQNAVRTWIDKNIRFPISFIDFEWDLFPIPPYEGMKPLQVLPFQYSLDVYYSDEEIKHYQFVEYGDCRKSMAERLVNEIPKEGTVIAYNAVGAEKLRISELAAYLPQYSEDLNQINSRMVDLALPFTSGLVYDVRMRGLFSLKVLEGIVDSEHPYSDLEINNGLKAVEIYRMMCSLEDEEQKKALLENLYEYCGMDSFSMLKVYKWLMELIS